MDIKSYLLSEWKWTKFSAKMPDQLRSYQAIDSSSINVTNVGNQLYFHPDSFSEVSIRSAGPRIVWWSGMVVSASKLLGN